jgi:hypothetical protein
VALDGLRKLGLAAVVHTETGRTERYRHYMRQRIAQLSEPQVAVLTELLLRGRQAAGELRSRASRMAPVGTLDTLEQLRTALAGLMEMKLAQADGPLERRGVEIDHNLYELSEEKVMTPRAAYDEEPVPGPAPAERPAPLPSTTGLEAKIARLEESLDRVQNQNRELESTVANLRTEIERLSETVERLDGTLRG